MVVVGCGRPALRGLYRHGQDRSRGVSPLLPVFLTLTVARRVGEYAIAKPAREVLFTVLNREDKYKAKNFIDTAVSRGGDASTGWLVSGVKALGATTGIMAGALVPLMLVWGWIGWRLGRQEAELQRGPAPPQ